MANFLNETCGVQEKKSTPVDVQVGTQLWTEAPQELRSRLWLALLQQPALGFLLSDQQVWCVFPGAPSSPCLSPAFCPAQASLVSC